MDVRLPPRDHELYDLMRGIEKVERRRPSYVEADRFYDGEIDEFFGHPAVRALLSASGKAHLIRLARIPVKTLANRVDLTGVTFSNASAQRAWDAAWSANDMEIWEPVIKLKTLVYGDSFVSVWPTFDEDGESENEDDDVLISGYTITWISPLHCQVIYDDVNPRIKLYAIEFFCEGKFKKAKLYYRDRIERFVTNQPGVDGMEWRQWQRDGHEVSRRQVDGQIVDVTLPSVEGHELDEIPIFHFTTDVLNGKPVHKEAYGAQRIIMKLIATHMASVDQTGWPTRFALQDPASVLDSNNEQPSWNDDASATATTGGATSEIKDKPGFVHLLSGIRDVKQLDAPDPNGFTDPIDKYIHYMSVATETPLYTFAPGGEQPSGKSRQIADAPLEANARSLRDLFAGTWRQIAKFAMNLLDVDPGDVEPKWAPSIMATTKDDWDAVNAALDAGAEFEWAMIELAGIDPAIAKAWKSERDKMEADRAEMIRAQMGEDDNGE